MEACMMWRRGLWCPRTVAYTCVAGVVLTCMVYWIQTDTNVKLNPQPPTAMVNVNRSSHIILAWTPIFGDWNWYPAGSGHLPFHNNLCNYDDCFLTTDKRFVDRADAILFHCRDDVGKWPEVRHARQLYGATCQESPMASNFGQYGGKMNLTITYRRDSDIYFPNCWFTQRTQTNENYRPVVKLTDRPSEVVWPVSNCWAESRRQLYVQELQKHIDIHVYGACGTYKCGKTEQCLKHFGRNYKFYISFENALCEDYVSEKFFLPLQHDLIPIVLGGEQFRAFPEKSFISIQDFQSPEALSEHLNYLSNNQTAYDEYFKWRAHFKFQCDNKEKLFCELCDMVRNQGIKKQYPDVNKWWSENKCDNSLVPKLLKLKQ